MSAGQNRLQAYGHSRRLPHTSFAPHLHVDITHALDLAMIQMDKVLTGTQLKSYQQGNLLLKTYDFKGYGSFKCAPNARRIAELFHVFHPDPVVSWPSIIHSRTNYFCPCGHGRESTNPPFVFQAPPAMIWCSTCRRPHGHNKWTCPCNLKWRNCVKHRPIEIQESSSSSAAPSVPSLRALSASASAAKLDKLEPHCASRLILSPGLAQRFPHLAGAPVGITSTLPVNPTLVQSTRVCNHTIHTVDANDEPQPKEQDDTAASPVTVPAVPVPQLPSISTATAGESNRKTRSRPFRRV